jgi:hypothetical protein
MNAFKNHSLIALLALVIALGCSHLPQKPNSESGSLDRRLSQTEAVRIAKQEAKRFGGNLHRYKEPEVSYEPMDKSWFFLFRVKESRYPGDYFGIFVDDQTGKARLFPGR